MATLLWFAPTVIVVALAVGALIVLTADPTRVLVTRTVRAHRPSRRTEARKGSSRAA